MWTPTIALLPGALMIYLGFDGGGYFPPATGVACVALAIALVLRLTLSPRPLEGFGLAAALGTGALGLFAVWSLVSTSWSDSPARAVAEFDRVLLYMLMLALIATLPRTTETVRTVLYGIAGAATFVCIGGLLTRVLPEVFPIARNVLDQRLSYPVTYWNGLGLLAAIAIVTATHFACSVREHPAARTIGAAVLPLLCATLFFTFSRASIAVAIFGVIAYVVIVRPRGLPSALVAALPTSAIAVVWAYNADELATPTPTTSLAVNQGEEVFLVLVLCSLGAAAARYALTGLDVRLANVEVPRRAVRIATLGLVGGAVLVAGTLWIALDVDDRISRQYEKFKEGDVIRQTEDARDRLTQAGNNGRIQHWEEALDGWHTDELKGTGAGTYELTWAKGRPSDFTVRDGHSLYLETLSEVGLVGALLLALVLVAVIGGLAFRTRGSERAMWGALLTASLVWALHAAQDWVWELPAVTLWMFAAGGAALARGPTESESHLIVLPRLARVIAALFVIALTVTPILNALADARIRDSITAFKQGDCPLAIERALDASSALGARPEPYLILGFCDVRLGKPALAERMMRNAIDRDPNSWVYRYGLALVQAANGKDPNPAIDEALRLNPREERTIRAQKAFASTDDPMEWKRRALRARLPIQ